MLLARLIGTVDGRTGTVGGWFGTVDGRMGTVGGWFGTVDGRMGTVGGWFGTVGGRMGTVVGSLRCMWSRFENCRRYRAPWGHDDHRNP
ncbi:hypothetical protein DFR67_111195 [Williamsia limnetica]|uniref:Uncharacterized protein n=1 Tax=Williamsia limnetica TaxID=882452 RepID=A0A318REV4_WILLI|nr:hypothetical protein [Williamsia limnetica]PYE15119.1 hypothetical protein DFR67_111195 [Williamsia limnetica]